MSGLSPHMRIRLTRKFANLIDGIDLSRLREGDIIDLSQREANTLLAEGWAERADDLAKPSRKRKRKTARGKTLKRRR